VKQLSRLILLTAIAIAPAMARVMDEDDSISFEIPWDGECHVCQGEWEPLFPPPQGPPTEAPLEFTGLSVGEEEPPVGEDVPEPMTWLLIGGGLSAMGLWRRKQSVGSL
jgi:hypothetical protein